MNLPQPPTAPRGFSSTTNIGGNSGHTAGSSSSGGDSSTHDLMYPMSVNEQLRTIFVGNIPEGVPETLVQTALKHIPGLEKWLPLKSPSTSSAKCGFARYSSAGSVRAALDVIPRARFVFEAKDINLIATSENNTLQWLETQNERCPVPNEELERQMNATLAIWKSGDGRVDEKENEPEESVEELYNRSLMDGSIEELREIPQEERELIMHEIKEFRKLSLKIEKERSTTEQEYEKERQRRIAQASEQALSGKKYDGDRTKADSNSIRRVFHDRSDEESETEGNDSELEAQRESRRKERLGRRFVERERRWRAREQTRASALEREKIRDENMDSRIQKDRELALRKYAGIRDESEHTAKSMLYYYDHATWVKERMIFRNREIEEDKRDALLEEEETKQNPSVLSSGTGTKFSLTLSKKQQHNQRQNISTPAPPQPIAASGVFADDFEENKAENTPSDRMKSRMALADEIPNDKEPLFAWKVKWDLLDSKILQNKIKPLVVSNIIEYLGVQEEELIDFVMQHVKAHKPPVNLVSELEMTLDEDAEVFTTQLWKTLIYETECRYRNID
ncbi:hypothetical protein TRICI_003762 [Trichomonascus ciferrii]|uniref:U1 small nuclear ribonucleoprotein component SNU71 n=1 Tax=Trichomonascus ciferrii TaxID=44093 RepID=A0A642V2A0_9ASCO|nr:hypothetical protein TRICI_003762 [Trichomonascus ciferrii]